MHSRFFTLLVHAVFAIMFLASPMVIVEVAADRPPNIIMVLVDDYGWTDLSYSAGQGGGSKLYETPHIDKLAARGVRFSNAYSACTVCSPTRASLLTGKYPARLHITDWIAGHNRPNAKLLPPDWTKYLPHDETTIAEALKAKGYATVSIGKWHLGNAKEGYPDAHGFDVNIGPYERGQPPSYTAPYKIPTLKEGPNGEYLTDREASEACQFMTVNKDKPFFIYLPHYAVHTPIQAKKEKIARYQHKITEMKEAGTLGDQHHAVYAAMIESLDEAMGAMVAKLEELKLMDNTIILFTGDNGGHIGSNITDNKPARAGKGSAYDGGTRVPLCIYAPGISKAGTLCEEPVITSDLFATMLELAGVKEDPRGSASADGLSLVPLLKSPDGKLDRAAIYWHYPHYHPGGATPYSAIRARNWKLIHFYEDDRVELYNLKDDVGEKKDLAASSSKMKDTLLAQLSEWRTSVGAQPPVKNPNFDEAKEKVKGNGKKNAK